MPDGFDAGSIFVRLRAELAEFNSGISKAKESLDSLGQGSKDVEVAFQELDTSVVVFKEIEDRSSRVKSAFATMGAETKRATEATRANTQATAQNEQSQANANVRWAQAANRILTVQIALLSLSQNANGPVRQAFQALSNGVSVAAGAMQILGENGIGVLKNKLSGLGGAAVAAGVAIISLATRYLEDSIKATDAASDQMEKTRKATDALANATRDAKDAIDLFGGTSADKLVAKLRLEETAFTSNLKRIREISDEVRKLTHDSEGRVLPFLPDESAARIESLKQESLNLAKQNDTIRKTGVFDKANADVAQLLQSTKDLNKELENTEIAGNVAIRLGIAEPAEVASTNLREAKAVLDKMISDDLKIQDAANAYGISADQRSELLKRLHSSAEYDAARKDFFSKQEIDKATKAVNDLATTFSTSIGDGLRDALINGQKPMEALATIGKNLFGNMIDQTVKRLETGLTEAFKAITGAAGEGIGLALTGILGAAGAVLSKLGSKGTDSFSGVQSAVTSSQAVRGIVAGPSSVAIATVGDNLQRSVGPLLAEQQKTNGWLERIERNTRGGGRGGPGSSNVAVATA